MSVRLLPSVVASVCFISCVSARPEARATTRCVVASSSNGSNDSPAIQDAFNLCSGGGTVEFLRGADYNVFTPITATSLTNVDIEMHGNLHLPQNISYIQDIVNVTSTVSGSDDVYWLTLKGHNLNYEGTSNVSTGWIYSYGQAWWDANLYPNTGLVYRPHLLSFDATVGTMKYFKSRKPIGWNVKLSGSDIEIDNTVIDAYSTTGSFPFNTDGFDVGATNVVISNSVIYNGDDAIAVGSGSHNITFKGGAIGYQTHGMSIGSLGETQSDFANVTDVLFDDVTVINGVYASRFKSWIGGQGLAKNVTWSNIRVYNVTFPIFVTQTYYDQGTASSAPSGRINNSTVNMQDFTWSDFTGTINTFMPGDGSCVTDPCWYDVGLTGLANTESIIVECNTEISCQNFEFSNIEVFPQSLEPPSVICINATTALNPDLGFVCENGTYIPT